MASAHDGCQPYGVSADLQALPAAPSMPQSAQEMTEHFLQAPT